MRTRINTGAKAHIGGLAGWLIAKFRRRQSSKPRLAVLDRIALGPRHSLALVEAEGRKILVATSASGGPVFFALDEKRGLSGETVSRAAGAPGGSAMGRARVSW